MFQISFRIPILYRVISMIDRHLWNRLHCACVDDYADFPPPRFDRIPRESPEPSAQPTPLSRDLTHMQAAGLELETAKTPASLARFLDTFVHFMRDLSGNRDELNQFVDTMLAELSAIADALRPLAGFADAAPITDRLADCLTRGFDHYLRSALMQLAEEPNRGEPQTDHQEESHAAAAVAQ